jgi:hypothetical protein
MIDHEPSRSIYEPKKLYAIVVDRLAPPLFAASAVFML